MADEDDDGMNKNETLTGICNSALAAVGHTEFIDDIVADNPICATLRIILEQAVKEVQGHEAACWDELMREAKLVKRGRCASKVKNRVEYNLPFRMIAPVSCFLAESGQAVRYEIVGGYLVCNEPKDVWLRYVAYNFEPNTWSTELKTCIIKLLSARALSALVKDYSGAQTAEERFWAYYFPLWAGNKKNKAIRSDFAGNDTMLSEQYPNPYGLGIMDAGGY